MTNHTASELRSVVPYSFIGTHIRVQSLPQKAHRKTCDYAVVNRKSGDTIGLIRWYGAWRQYCFFPGGDTVWSRGCLENVTRALKEIAAAKGRATL